MKKGRVCFLGITLCLLTGLSAFAQQGGYKGPGAAVVTVDEAKGLRDDAQVIIRGKIERSLGDEKYLFTDPTGSVTVEIDDHVWGTLSADQNDEVEISGEVDREFAGVEIEVRSIKKR